MSVTPIKFNFNLRFNELEEASEFLTQRVGPVFVEAEKGKQIEIATSATFIGHCTIFKSDLKRQVTVQPLIEQDFQSFILPIAGTLELWPERLKLEGNPRIALAVDGAKAQRAHYSADECHICIVFPKAVLTERLSIILDRCIPGPIRFEPIVDCGGNKLSDVMFVADAFTTRVDAESLSGSSLLAQRLKELLLDLILVGWTHNYSSLLQSDERTATPFHLSCAIEAVETDPMAILSVSDLASIAGVSVRALQKSFEKHLGVRPIEYLRNARLERAGQDLVANPYEPIADIAKRWGFLNAGRFSEYFRKKFGTLPNEYRIRTKKNSIE